MTLQHNPLLLGFHGAPRAGKDESFKRTAQWVDSFNEVNGRGVTFRRRGFADKLKWSLARIFIPGISMEDAIVWCDRLKLDEDWRIVLEHRKSPTHHEIDLAMRDLLRYYGTESARDVFGLDFWVDQLLPINEYSFGVGGGFKPPDATPMLSNVSTGWHREFEVQGFGSTPRIAIARVADVCGITDVRFDNEIVRIKALGGTLVKVRNEEAVRKVIEAAERDGKLLHRSDLELPDDLFDVILDNNDWRTRPEYLSEQVAVMMEERIAA